MWQFILGPNMYSLKRTTYTLYLWGYTFKNLLKSHWSNFNKTRHKTFDSKGISYLFKRRTLSFQRGDNNKIAKIQLRNLAQFQPILGKNRV